MIVERLSGRQRTLTGLATVCQLESHVPELPLGEFLQDQKAVSR